MSRPVPLLLLLLLLLSSALFASCGGEAAEPEPIAPESSGAATSAPTRWIAPRAPADTSLLEAPAVVRAVEATGEVSAGARVRVVRIHVQPGSRVEAGAPIVDVASPELLEAAALYLGAGRGARAHEERAVALEALRSEGLANNTQVFEHRSRATELATERDRAAALLRSVGVDPRSAPSVVRRGSFSLLAPVAGVVAALHARPGEVHEPGSEPLARLVGVAAPRIEVRSSVAWPEASGVRFVASDGRVIELAATPLSRVVDPEDGSELRWYAPSEPCALPDGLTGSARLGGVREAWEVPVNAVAQRTGSSELLRRRGESTERISVEVLLSSGASALVRGDLREGDVVASDLTLMEESQPEGRQPEEGQP